MIGFENRDLRHLKRIPIRRRHDGPYNLKPLLAYIFICEIHRISCTGTAESRKNNCIIFCSCTVQKCFAGETIIIFHHRRAANFYSLLFRVYMIGPLSSVDQIKDKEEYMTILG